MTLWGKHTAKVPNFHSSAVHKPTQLHHIKRNLARLTYSLLPNFTLMGAMYHPLRLISWTAIRVLQSPLTNCDH